LVYCYANQAATSEGPDSWIHADLLAKIEQLPEDGNSLLEDVHSTVPPFPPSPPARLPSFQNKADPVFHQPPDDAEIVPTLKREASDAHEKSKKFPVAALGLVVIGCCIVNLVLFLTCCGIIKMGEKKLKKQI